MHHVFVSYSRSNASWVGQLVGRLERHGLRLWVDQRDIPVTLPWLEEVQDAITEADLFLSCDSPTFRESAACSAEKSLADQAGKRQCQVSVSSDLTLAENTIRQAWQLLEPARIQRTELAVLARDWDRSGRPRGGLVNALVRRRLSQGLAAGPSPTAVEQAFLRLSRSRSLRRGAATATAAVVLAAGGLAYSVFTDANNKISNDNSSEAAIYTGERTFQQDVIDDPYRGLAVAKQLGSNESAAYADVVDSALADPVPVDAFTVPTAASRFAVHPVGGHVIVASRGGRQWQRAATADDVRSARPTGSAAGGPTAGASGYQSAGLGFRRDGNSGMVSVLKQGRLWRRITFANAPGPMTLSPDGRNLAVAEGTQVQIADLRAGMIRTTLRGAPARILDLAWSASGQRVWALSRGKVVAWQVGDGTTLIDDQATAFDAVLPAAVTGAVWAVSSTGRLTEVDVRTGQVLAVRRVPDQVSTAAGSSDGRFAVLSGKRREWIVPLTGSTPPRSFNVPGCSPNRPAVGDGPIFYLPCAGGDLLTVSAASGTITRRTAVSPAGVFTARVLPGSRDVLVGDEDGNLWAVSPADVTLLWRNRCGGSIDRIAVSPEGQSVLPVGAGTGFIGCTEVGSSAGGDPVSPANWTWNNLLDTTSSFVAETAAYTSDGRDFAIGYSDGTIIVHPTAAILPTETITAVDGHIRDMLMLPGNDLIVATDAGMVQSIPLCATCVSNKVLARVAGARLARGLALGLAVRRSPAPARSARSSRSRS